MSCKKCIPFIKEFDGASIPGVQLRNEFDFCVVICVLFLLCLVYLLFSYASLLL